MLSAEPPNYPTFPVQVLQNVMSSKNYLINRQMISCRLWINVQIECIKFSSKVWFFFYSERSEGLGRFNCIRYAKDNKIIRVEYPFFNFTYF